MTYKRALENFEEAIDSVDREDISELWHLVHGLRAFCSAVRSDLNDLKGRPEKTQQNVARVNAEVAAAQGNLHDILKGLE